MTARDRPALGLRAAAALTGLWLALWQVALAMTLLRTAGASVQQFFALTAAWLLGGVAGARSWAEHRLPSGVRAEDRPSGGRRILPVALLLGVAAKVVGAAVPFSPVAAALPLVAGAVAGAYAGVFLASRASRWTDVGRLLLIENNGFVLGYAVAFVLLVWRAGWLDAAALTLGVGLWLGPPRRLTWVAALALGVASGLYYLLHPYVGDRGWDGLMTATVLVHPDWVTLREVLFFAHPLVIPLTVPLHRLGLDPLDAAAAREALCAGGGVALAYLAAAALSKSRWAGGLAAALLTLAVWRWRLATCGEEKEVAQLFGAGFLFLYLDHRGLWELPLPSWRAHSRGLRRAVLSALLALAVAVHLVNGALALVVLGDGLLSRPAAQRRQAAGEAAWVLGGAAGLAGPFFLWLAMGPGGARSAHAVLRYFLEYHLSGEFLALPWVGSASLSASVGERLLLVYASARAWLLGSAGTAAALPSAREACLVLAGLALLLGPVLRSGPPAARRLLGWALLGLAHACVFDSANPESVAPAMTVLTILGAAGLRWPAPPRWRWLPPALGVAAVLLVARAHWAQDREARRAATEVRALLALPSPAPAPLADLCQLLDAELPREALLLVSDRLHASYFHIYTRRRPLVTEYLDESPESLRQHFALTSLSLQVYRPALGRAAVAAAIAAGRPVYLLSTQPLSGVPQRDLGWQGLRIYTLSPPESAAAPPSP